ncbi:hypothetical protein [Dyadobacter fermentans]|uniref:hypothetical protein n=1 Tax=Dyadobacter fermentans TaxID=94254 RepID=UPI001CBF7A91|nr:hypothetical protein [Dyadobacter fermentans]MBZ1362150.1 hypothetical protein [Dyadobacter fermentans]
MKDKTLNRIAMAAAIGAFSRAASRHITKASAVALEAEKKRVEDSNRRHAVAMIDGKVIGECYFSDLPGKGPVEVSVTPIGVTQAERIAGEIKKTSPQKEDMKAWKRKHGLR